MPTPELLSIFLAPLERTGFDYFVTGSIASIFYGEPRLTHDVDIVLHLDGNRILDFSALFPLNAYYCPPEEVLEVECRRLPYGHFNLIHHTSGFKADIYLEGEDPPKANF